MRLLLLVPSGPDPEAAGAEAWATAAGFAVRAVRIDASVPPPEVAPGEIPWCHAGTAVPVLPGAWERAVSAWLRGGGRLLLSLLAAPLAAALGATGPAPRVVPPHPWRDADDPLWPPDFRDWPDYPHIRGAQGWGAHPLFDGLGRGAYTWKATEGEPVARCSYRRPEWPDGEVLAVERAYVALHADEAVAWTHRVGEGRILCLGANVAFTAAATALRAGRDRYVHNALSLCDPSRRWGGDDWVTWPVPSARAGAAPIVEVETSGLPAPALAPLPAQRMLSAPGVAPLVCSGAARADAPFSLAGRRALVVGGEQRGVQEVWLHPLCVLSEGARVTVDGAAVSACEIDVAPQRLRRIVADGRGRQWREVIAVSAESALVRYEFAPVGEALGGVAQLDLSLRLRPQWPMLAGALLPLTVRRRQEGSRAVVCIGAAGGPLEVRLALDGVAACIITPEADAVRMTAASAPGQALRLAMAGDVRGPAALHPAWRQVQDESMDAMLRGLAARDASRRSASVQLTTPEERLDVAWEWAKARLASFVISAPGVGTGLAAGYAASRPGWGDARPGYAWFFGRDACWCGDALLAAGLFDEARVALEFLASTAACTGKVAHEVTTSGVAHYDAADATPLWLRFVARYAEWTGDLETVRSLRDVIARSVDFVRSTDHDGDGLPDNREVGHGWIESGPLGGGAVTSYTASIWIDALRRLAVLATRLDDAALAGSVHEALARAEQAFEGRLRDVASGRVLLQRRLVHDAPTSARPHGAARDEADADLTALSAVPILLGVDRHPSADHVVEHLSGPDYATPWGVRLLSRRDARYRPRGYHVGAVWPLYTGWVSLACFARARPELGWRHLRAVTDAAFHRERGAFDEVLDGDTGEGAGICPDQAWSAAMVISPVVDGMLGLIPAAPDGRCTLAPQWPSSWHSAHLRGLRVGGSRFSLAMRREGEALHSTLSLDSGAPLDVHLAGDGAQPGRLVPGEAVTVTRTAAPDGRDDDRR